MGENKKRRLGSRRLGCLTDAYLTVRLFRARASPGRVHMMDVMVARSRLHRGPDDIRVNPGVKNQNRMAAD